MKKKNRTICGGREPKGVAENNFPWKCATAWSPKTVRVNPGIQYFYKGITVIPPPLPSKTPSIASFRRPSKKSVTLPSHFATSSQTSSNLTLASTKFDPTPSISRLRVALHPSRMRYHFPRCWTAWHSLNRVMHGLLWCATQRNTVTLLMRIKKIKKKRNR